MIVHSILVPEQTIHIRLNERFFGELLKEQAPTEKELAEMVGDLLFCASDYGNVAYMEQFKALLKTIIEDGDEMVEFYKGVFDD